MLLLFLLFFFLLFYSSNSISEFEQIVNSQYDESKLQDGYAPFCKHIFIENDFTDARVNVLEITSDNESLLRTKYERRNEKEVKGCFLLCWFYCFFFLHY